MLVLVEGRPLTIGMLPKKISVTSHSLPERITGVLCQILRSQNVLISLNVFLLHIKVCQNAMRKRKGIHLKKFRQDCPVMSLYE